MNAKRIPVDCDGDDPADEWGNLGRLLAGGDIELVGTTSCGPPGRPGGRGGEVGAVSNNGFLAHASGSPAALEVAKTCHKIPALLPTFVRCGKPTCRCNDGHLHGPYWVLRWREGATNRRRYVRQTDVDAVRAAIERRRRERAAERLVYLSDLALLRRLGALRRELDAALAAEGRDR